MVSKEINDLSSWYSFIKIKTEIIINDSLDKSISDRIKLFEKIIEISPKKKNNRYNLKGKFNGGKFE